MSCSMGFIAKVRMSPNNMTIYLRFHSDLTISINLLCHQGRLAPVQLLHIQSGVESLTHFASCNVATTAVSSEHPSQLPLQQDEINGQGDKTSNERHHERTGVSSTPPATRFATICKTEHAK